MGEVADDMMAEAQRWSDESVVCQRGHRFLPSEWGCPECEMEAEMQEPECKLCHGRGYVGANSLDMLREPCPDCGGNGDLVIDEETVFEIHKFDPSPDGCLVCGKTFGDGLHT